MKNRKKAFILAAFAAFLPYFLYGFQYFPVLDDYIQYWGYPARQNLTYVYTEIGTLSTRPLASLLDPAFWGQMWSFLWLALFLILIMHLISGCFFVKTLENYHVSLSPLFLLIYWLFPLGMEGRFWLSASTRLITGLFFASLSLWMLSLFLQKKQSVFLFVLFALFQLISCGFYESVSVFSVSAAVLLFLVSFYESRKAKLLFVPLVSCANIGFMFYYYRLFAGLGHNESRAAGLELWRLSENIAALFRQLGEILSQTFDAVIKGSVEGCKILVSHGLWGILLLCTALIIAFFLCRCESRQIQKSKILRLSMICCGILLFFAPLVPNLLVSEVWLTHRSLFVSFIGLALLVEPLFSLFKKTWRQALLFAVAFLFITAGVNEYDVYRRVHEQDRHLLKQVVSQMNEEAKSGGCDVVVLLPKSVETAQNTMYKDHVKSVFDSDWALTGAVRAEMESLLPRRIVPVLPGETYETQGVCVVELHLK
ncbi:MAG: glucosyltransferase domain-containing protein [Clostridia bacterium]|nr:glucosyltransferase domain-containing protein [Clostridia bacterium]